MKPSERYQISRRGFIWFKYKMRLRALLGTHRRIYVYTYHGIQYNIYDREPKLGELACTWYAGKQTQLQDHPLPLNVFAYDENCAAASDNYDFKYIKIKPCQKESAKKR